MALYSSSGSSMTFAASTDLFHLRGAVGVVCRIKEVRLFQVGSTTLAMTGVKFIRGTGAGAGASEFTDYKMNITDSAPSATVNVPTGNVSSLDFNHHMGWNILQEFVWLATPELEIVVGATQDFAVQVFHAQTLGGFTIFWEESST